MRNPWHPKNDVGLRDAYAALSIQGKMKFVESALAKDIVF